MAAAGIQPGRAPINVDEFGERAVALDGGRVDYTISDPLGPVSGFTNYTPQQMRVVALWKKWLREVYELGGFTPIDTAPVEYACNLQKTGGLDKQMYGLSRLQDGSLTKLGVPFDRTVPMALFLAKQANQVVFPYSRHDIGWAFRGESARAGRYRAFIQADVDTVAPELNALADTQCIVTIINGLRRLGVPNFKVQLNHVSIAKAFLTHAGIAPEKHNDALRAIDKLKPDNEPEVIAELMENVPGLSREASKSILDKMSFRGAISAFEFKEEMGEEAKAGLAHLREIVEIAETLGVPADTFEFTANLTRGLSYYTGVVFETLMPGREGYGSIASGGRYDDLVGEFNEKVKLKGVGGSIGLTRLFDVMQAEGLVDLRSQTTTQIFVGYRTLEQQKKAIEVAAALRKAGISAELQLVPLAVKKQLAYADKKGFEGAVLVMNNDEINWKDLSQVKDSEVQTPQQSFTTVAALVAAMSAV